MLVAVSGVDEAVVVVFAGIFGFVIITSRVEVAVFPELSVAT